MASDKPHAAAVRAVVFALEQGYISGVSRTALAELKHKTTEEYTPLVKAVTAELDRWPDTSFVEIRAALRETVGEEGRDAAE